MLPYGCPIAQMACCVGHCRLLSVHLRDKCHLWWQWAPFAESAHISSVTLRECVVLTLFFSWDTPFAKGVLPEVASIIFFFFILLKSHSISECHLCNRRLVNSCSGPLTCPLLFHGAQKSEAESCDFCVVLFIEQLSVVQVSSFEDVIWLFFTITVLFSTCSQLELHLWTPTLCFYQSIIQKALHSLCTRLSAT